MLEVVRRIPRGHVVPYAEVARRAGSPRAYRAAGNILNIANTNIVDSNYMMVVFNNFGSWNGDFILPGADYFSNVLNNPENALNYSQSLCGPD